MSSLSPIDVNAALGLKNAAHLLRRATFGPTHADIETFSSYSLLHALDVLFTEKPAAAPPLDVVTGQNWLPKPGDGNSKEDDLMNMTLSWWLDLIVSSGNDMTDRMAWFYHSHFTTIKSRINRSTPIYYQIQLFRYFALGNFRELSKKICYDNAMLVHLDGRLNNKGQPNENFGREFMELFTIGKGQQVSADDYTTYTEHDVRQAARVLSGYGTDYDFANIDPDTGVAMGVLKGSGDKATQHDAGEKTFSERFQQTIIKPIEMIDDEATKAAALDELDQFVHMIYSQEATARHICRKLYRYFVYYDITPQVEQDIIVPLAQVMMDNDYEMKPVLTALLSSQHFYDTDNAIVTDDSRGAIIKSPLELTAGTLRFFNVQLPDAASNLAGFYESYIDLLRKISSQGLDIYEPFEVAGYTAYHQTPDYNRNWISNNNLAERYQFSSQLLLGHRDEDDNLLYKLNILKYCQDVGVDLNTPTAIVQHFVDNMLPEAITQERFDYYKSTLLIDVDEANWKQAVIDQEDFQVVFHLEGLVNAMMQSPEYQLM